MEEKTPFSFRNQPNYKTTVTTMKNEDFVQSLNKEMERILHKIDPKPLNPLEDFHGSPNFNQDISNNFSKVPDRRIIDENHGVFLDNNDSFGQEKEIMKEEEIIPNEMYNVFINYRN